MEFKPSALVRMVLWKKTDMPEKARNIEGKYEPTGKTVEMSTYTFHDEFGSELKFTSPKNEYREFINQEVQLIVRGEYNDYDRKNQWRLVNVLPARTKVNNA